MFSVSGSNSKCVKSPCQTLLFLEAFTSKQEERFECKAGDAFGKQRRFPHPLFWDYKVTVVPRPRKSDKKVFRFKSL